LRIRLFDVVEAEVAEGIERTLFIDVDDDAAEVKDDSSDFDASKLAGGRLEMRN
jgi:hypothetical protein